MKFERTETLWLHEHYEVSLPELAELSGLSEGELRELAEDGVIAPLDSSACEWTFSAQCVVIARTACRFRDDFELDAHGVALMTRLLERIRELEAEVCALRAQQPRRN